MCEDTNATAQACLHVKNTCEMDERKDRHMFYHIAIEVML